MHPTGEPSSGFRLCTQQLHFRLTGEHLDSIWYDGMPSFEEETCGLESFLSETTAQAGRYRDSKLHEGAGARTASYCSIVMEGRINEA